MPSRPARGRARHRPRRAARGWKFVIGTIPTSPTRPVVSRSARLRARPFPRTSRRVRAIPISLLH